MKVKMNTGLASSEPLNDDGVRVLNPGKEYDLPETLARALVEGGTADSVESKPANRKQGTGKSRKAETAETRSGGDE